jgi:hypothetical protein
MNELERIWKDVVVDNLRYYAGTCLRETEGNQESSQVRIAGAHADIRT